MKALSFLKKFQSLLLVFSFLIILTLIASWPLLLPGFYESHDGEWMVIRLTAFHQSLVDGHFPVRWVERLNHGFGYPVMNFLYPLPFYLGEILHLLGFSFVWSIKLVFLLSIFLSGFFMFLFSKRVFGLWGGLVAASFYIFVPYRFVDIYARGSVGEALALSFIPLLFLAIYDLAKKFTLGSVLIGTISVFGLVTSHNVIAFVLIPPALIFFLANILSSKEKVRVILSYFTFVLFGLALSAFFWIPALYDLRFVVQPQVSIANVFDHLLNFSDLILPRWGYGPAKPGDPSSISFQIGVIHLIVFLLSIPISVFLWIKKSKFFLEIIPFQLIFLLASFLMLSYTAFVWKAIPSLSVIQFPWRMLSITAFASSVVAASIFSLIPKRIGWLFLTAVILVLVGLNFLYIKPKNFIDKPEGFYTTNEDTTTVRDEFLPIWSKNLSKERASSKIEFTKSEAFVQEEVIKTGNYTYVIYHTQPIDVKINTLYFPGWQLFVDGVRQEIDPQKGKGLITFSLNPELDRRHRIELIFKETPLRMFSNILSIISWLSVFFVAIYFLLAKRKFLSALGIFSAIVLILNISWFIFINRQDFGEKFDPVFWEEKFLKSQWVNPDFTTQQWLGDWGLYSWAGWQYIHGLNPVLLNPEHPPLGKYIIGVGLLVFKNIALVGLISSFFSLFPLYLLSNLILKDRLLAIIPISLLSLEKIFMSNVSVTMLDPLQLGFLALTFYFFIKGLEKPKNFILVSLMLGGVLSTKFFMGGILVMSSLLMFLIARKKIKLLLFFIFSLPLAFLVHFLSYLSFLLAGHTIREYLGVQKWIIDFYKKSAPSSVPPFSFWGLVFLNKWRVWWGPRFGEFYTLSSDSWRITWPLGALSFVVVFYHYLARFFMRKIKGVKFLMSEIKEEDGVLLSWLFFYFLFLSIFSGFPNYLILALPFTNILLLKVFLGVHNFFIKKNLKYWKDLKDIFNSKRQIP